MPVGALASPCGRAPRRRDVHPVRAVMLPLDVMDAEVTTAGRAGRVGSSDEWVPVCVLGPLAGPDKNDLQNAITHYLKEPPEGIW
ncbi:hypothetical protein [Streptomyces sp. NPDC058463]|uniref:hypothetical protein n=1 Tax=Streptomyces sp. NPDC058463 TaxID=3346510 RepID=UPI00364FA251